MFARHLIGSLAVTLALGIGAALPLARGAHAASSGKVYTNTLAGYTMNYPAGWTLQRNAHDTVIMPPDQNGLIGITWVSGSLSLSDIRRLERKAGAAVGTFQGAISYGAQALGRYTYQAAEATVKTSDGHLFNFLALEVTRGKYSNFFTAFVLRNSKSTNLETNEIVNSFMTITFR